MKISRYVLLALVSAFAFAVSARADSMNLWISGTTDSNTPGVTAPLVVDLTLTYAPTSTPGTDLITAASGWISTPDGKYKSHSFDVTTNALFTADNLLFPSAGATPGLMNWNGLLIEKGAFDFNLFSDGTNWYWADNGAYYGNFEMTNATTTVTPEPGSLFLLATGLLFLALLVFRRAKLAALPLA